MTGKLTKAAARLAPSIRFVATNLVTLEEFAVCAKLPFSCFQGPFITRRESWDRPKIDAVRVRILELLNQLRHDAGLARLTALFKQDPALSFKLLRYINSPGMGLLHRIGSLDQALLVLGRQNLYRWLTLLLFTSGESRGLDSALLENALVRARLAELLARKSLSADEQNDLFVAGVFSLLDVLMGTPLETILGQVSLPRPVHEALLHGQGKYAPYLKLAIACEQHDEESVHALAGALGHDGARVNDLHLDALLWAQQVGQ